MLGIEDPWIAVGYLLSVLSALACVVYGAVMWNRGDDAPTEVDIRWAARDREVE